MDAKNCDRYRAHEAECIRHAELAIDDATRRSLEGLRTNGTNWLNEPTAPIAVIAATADTSRSRGSIIYQAPARPRR